MSLGGYVNRTRDGAYRPPHGTAEIGQVICLAVFNQVVSAEGLLAHPSVYKCSADGSQFSIFQMGMWTGQALLHSLICLVVLQIYAGVTTPSGMDDGLFLMGTSVNLVVVVLVTLVACTLTNYWTVWNLSGLTFSMSLWVIFVSVYSRLMSAALGEEFFGLWTNFRLSSLWHR